LDIHSFTEIRINDFTEKIKPTSLRMYKAYLLGAIPSKLYNLLFNASAFSKEHYKSGFYQYKSLQLGLWKYYLVGARKPETA
jgi:hypothetical protein